MMKKYISLIKRYISLIKYNFEFLGVLRSPFVGLTTKWYFGKIKHGTPIFLPRKWVKCDLNDAKKAWSNLDQWTKDSCLMTTTFHDWMENYMKTHTKAVPIKYFGINFTPLGYKTKYDEYCFEWSPSISIVLFGMQLFIKIIPNIKNDMDLNDMTSNDQYWEGWLNYLRTDKLKSADERIIELISKWNCTWISTFNNGTVSINYYYRILKTKYHKHII